MTEKMMTGLTKMTSLNSSRRGREGGDKGAIKETDEIRKTPKMDDNEQFLCTLIGENKTGSRLSAKNYGLFRYLPRDLSSFSRIN